MKRAGSEMEAEGQPEVKRTRSEGGVDGDAHADAGADVEMREG